MRTVAALMALIFVVGCSPTSHVLVGEQRPAISPVDVKVYFIPPAHFEQVAILHSTSQDAFALGDQAKMDVIINRLKADAASLGANGILFRGATDRYAGSIGGVSARSSYGGGVLSAFALAAAVPIFVKEGSGLAIYVDPNAQASAQVLTSAQAPSAVEEGPDEAAPDPDAHDYLYNQSAPALLPPRNLGAVFGPNDSGLSVVSIEKSGPAAKAGLRAGDLITAINGRPTAPIYWERAVQLLAKPGSSIDMVVAGKGELTLRVPAQ